MFISAVTQSLPLVHVMLGVVQPEAHLDRVALAAPVEYVLHSGRVLRKLLRIFNLRGYSHFLSLQMSGRKGRSEKCDILLPDGWFLTGTSLPACYFRFVSDIYGVSDGSRSILDAFRKEIVLTCLRAFAYFALMDIYGR